MATISGMTKAWQAINLTNEAAEVLVNDEEIIVDFQRQQLYHGKDKFGEELSPKYTEDPYFKTPEAAIRYAKWKQNITPDPERPWDVPNLFITGRYHGSISLDVSGDKFKLHGNDENSSNIEAKFKTAMGLNPNSAQQYSSQYLMPALVKRISAKTGCRTS